MDSFGGGVAFVSSKQCLDRGDETNITQGESCIRRWWLMTLVGTEYASGTDGGVCGHVYARVVCVYLPMSTKTWDGGVGR